MIAHTIRQRWKTTLFPVCLHVSSRHAMVGSQSNEAQSTAEESVITHGQSHARPRSLIYDKLRARSPHQLDSTVWSTAMSSSELCLAINDDDNNYVQHRVLFVTSSVTCLSVHHKVAQCSTAAPLSLSLSLWWRTRVHMARTRVSTCSCRSSSSSSSNINSSSEMECGGERCDYVDTGLYSVWMGRIVNLRTSNDHVE